VTQLTPEVQELFRGDQRSEIAATIDSEEVDAVVLTDSEFAGLVAFLNALTSPSLPALPAQDIPDRVPSGLPLAD